MNKHNFVSVVSYLFLVIGIMHGLRLLYGWEVEFNGSTIPMWASWVGVVVAFYLSYWGFRYSKSI